jgi:hypothetical protein
MAKNRKIPTEKEMLDQLREGKIQFPPLAFRFLEDRRDVVANRRFDAFIEAKWQQNIARFAVECKALSTPKIFQDSVNFLKSFSPSNDYLPMLFMPYLSEQQLQDLEREGLSGIDLCGNGVVIVQGTFVVYRSGGKNRFPSSALIKNTRSSLKKFLSISSCSFFERITPSISLCRNPSISFHRAEHRVEHRF